MRGFSERRIRVEIPREKLVALGITVDDIAAAVEASSIEAPTGGLESDREELTVRFADERRSVAEYAALVVVTTAEGAVIRLGDLAHIHETFETDEERIFYRGGDGARLARAGVIDIKKTKTEDSLRVYARVEDFLEKVEEDRPEEVTLVLTQDTTSVVKDRLDMLVKNGWQGLVLVLIAMTLFFSFRFSFWVAAGLPVSFLAALFFMEQMGLSLNMLTMVALLIALGLLMDDAIVIAENIASHMARGASGLEAASRGTAEVAGGVLSSFATTVCVFGPLAFLSGNNGRVLEVMPVVLILVLAVSLIEAFAILPNHLSHSRVDPSRRPLPRRAFDEVFEFFRNHVIGRIVRVAVTWRWLVFGVTIMVFLLSVGQVASGRVKFEAFPEIDGDVVQARILLPQGTPLERTEEVVDELIAALDRTDDSFRPRQPDERSLIEGITVAYGTNLSAKETGPHVATITVDLLSTEVRDARVDEVFARWREETPALTDVLAIQYTEPSFGPAGRPIEVRLAGDDLDELESAAHEVTEWLARFEGVFDLTDDLRPGKPEVRIRLEEEARSLGLTSADLSQQLRSAFQGRKAAEFQVGADTTEVEVRLADADRAAIDDLDAFRVQLPSGELVALPTVAIVETDRGFGRIARVDGARTVTVEGDLDPTITNAAEILKRLEAEALPDILERHPGVRVDLQGQTAEAAKTQQSMMRGMVIGMLGIFILLSFQFRSWIEPLVVMVAIPLALIGVVWGHVIMGYNLTMPSMIGFVSLAGIVVNDSISSCSSPSGGSRTGSRPRRPSRWPAGSVSGRSSSRR